MIKAKSQKQLQVAEQIRRDMAEIFANDYKLSFPGIYLTITKADVSPDIKNAKIFVNVFGNTDKVKLIDRLNDSAPYFRGQLSKKIKIRHTPELLFILDDLGNHSTRMNKLIEDEKKKFH